MEITAEMQNYTDYDWFAVDMEGHLAHFASGGSRIPRQIAQSQTALTLVAAYFRDLEFLSTEIDLTATAHAFLNTYTGGSGTPLKSFLDYSNRGLYSYDIVRPSNLDCGTYRMISIPGRKLHISGLPSAVERIVRNLTINDVFGNLETLDIYQL